MGICVSGGAIQDLAVQLPSFRDCDIENSRLTSRCDGILQSVVVPFVCCSAKLTMKQWNAVMCVIQESSSAKFHAGPLLFLVVVTNSAT